MGLFKKKAELKPKVTAQGIEATFSPLSEDGYWEFTYRETDFVCFAAHLRLPAKEALDQIIEQTGALEPEMRQRLATGWSEWKGVRADNDGESYSINIEDYSTTGEFEVSWSGGETWGDMGIDFLIKDGKIADESWGD